MGSAHVAGSNCKQEEVCTTCDQIEKPLPKKTINGESASKNSRPNSGAEALAIEIKMQTRGRGEMRLVAHTSHSGPVLLAPPISCATAGCELQQAIRSSHLSSPQLGTRGLEFSMD